jgi:hypothetical protein
VVMPRGRQTADGRPIERGPSFEWALMWREAAETARVRAFAEVARLFRASVMG